MQLTEELFKKDVSKHVMTVLLDDGVYRHIKFADPDTCIQAFSIVTWPGHLCYTGDMGTFVFSRVHDMFEFFRNKPGNINPGYWGEKCIAQDMCDGLREYSPEKAKDVIDSWMQDQVEVYNDEYESDNAIAFETNLVEAVEDNIYAYMDSEYELRKAVEDFEFTWEGKKYSIHDFWEYNLKVKTQRFMWCCYALVWAIKLWDDYKEAKDELRVRT